MKKAFAIAAVIGSCISVFGLNAQNEKTFLDDYESVNFYGVDFSLTKVIGASESSYEFLAAFEKIDSLIVTEPEKYVDGIAKRLNKDISYVNIAPTLAHIKDIDPDELKVEATPAPLDNKDIEFALLDLDYPKATGLGLVVFAEYLDKTRPEGKFNYVFFDLETRKIVAVLSYTAKPIGLGLRNYWAGAFSRTFPLINPSKFYLSGQKLKEGFKEGFEAVRDAVKGK